MIFVKILLFPFSLMYQAIASLRNHLFNIGYSRSFHFDIPTISVGNLEVGGTGKTPMIEYLIRLLDSHYKLATLSRGYGRRSKGFILAQEGVSAYEIGDEPMQLFHKFKGAITVAVGEERALAIPSILLERPDTGLILLDDAYQHRTVRPDINLLLTRYDRLFYDDIVLPAGRLRESRSGAIRADAVVVTKCPETLGEKEMQDKVNSIRQYTKKDTPVFFSAVTYSAPVPIYSDSVHPFNTNVLLFTGIASASQVRTYAAKSFNLLETIDFPDHKFYSLKDIESILTKFRNISGEGKCIITTEKDMVRLQSTDIKNKFSDIPIYYLPIEVKFLKDGNLFDEFILNGVKKNNN